MKEAAITKAFVKMMAAFVTMVGKDPMIVLVNELTTTVLLRPALSVFAKNNQLLCLLVIRTPSNFDRQSLIYSDLNYTTECPSFQIIFLNQGRVATEVCSKLKLCRSKPKTQCRIIHFTFEPNIS